MVTREATPSSRPLSPSENPEMPLQRFSVLPRHPTNRTNCTAIPRLYGFVWMSVYPYQNRLPEGKLKDNGQYPIVHSISPPQRGSSSHRKTLARSSSEGKGLNYSISTEIFGFENSNLSFVFFWGERLGRESYRIEQNGTLHKPKRQCMNSRLLHLHTYKAFAKKNDPSSR